MKKLRPTGGYRKLASFQTTTLIYDATVAFCKKFIDPYSRTTDQMVQAARSGRQNIAEGNRAGSTSTHSELKLTNVARASQEELLLDFEDYLRQHNLPLWPKDAPEASHVRALARQCQKQDPSDQTDPSDLSLPTDQGDRARYCLYRPWLEHEDPATGANAIICLIHQANYLLDQQLIAMEQAFVEGGGYRETLATARIAKRTQDRRNQDRTDPTNPSDQKESAPHCQACGKPMAIRTAKTGPNQGSQFWGCTGYPDCKQTLPV